MFLKITFATCLVVIGTSSANPCNGSDPKIKVKLQYTDDNSNVNHCLFRLPVDKEKECFKNISDTTKKFDKVNATRHCQHYMAQLPQLKDGTITRVLTREAGQLCTDPENGCAVLIGLKVTKKVSDTSVNVVWDKSSTEATISQNIYDTPYQLAAQSCDGNKTQMHLLTYGGNWECAEIFKETANVFCHYQSEPMAKATMPAATGHRKVTCSYQRLRRPTTKIALATTALAPSDTGPYGQVKEKGQPATTTTTSKAPKSAASIRSGSIEKVIASAVLTLVICQMLPGRMDE